MQRGSRRRNPDRMSQRGGAVNMKLSLPHRCVVVMAILFLLLATATVGAAQATISGTVYDSNRAVIVGATVTLEPLDGAAGRVEAQTDANGAFDLGAADTSRRYRLTVRARGFSAHMSEIAGSSSALSIVLQPEGVGEQVTVQETVYAVPNATAATKTDTPIMQTPVSIQVIPQEIMKDQQVTRITDALRNVSGVFGNQGAGGTVEAYIIRGFSDINPFYNGVRLDTNSGQGERDPAGIERIEVFKGPVAILYGRIEPGGLVNLVPKTPLNKRYLSVQQQIGSFDFYRTTVDSSGPITGDGELLYRLNFAYENTESFRDFIKGSRYYVAPTLQWNISNRTRATLYVDYLDYDIVPDRHGAPVLSTQDRVADIPRERNLGEAFSTAFAKDLMIGVNASHTFSDAWALNYRIYLNSISFDEIRVTPRDILPGDQELRRRQVGALDSPLDTKTLYQNLDTTGRLKTGSFEHRLLAGTDYTRSRSSTRSFPTQNIPGSININNPVYSGSPLPINPALFVNNSFDLDAFGIYLQDQVRVWQGFHVLAGMRYDYARPQNASAGQEVSATDDRIAPWVGLLWQPVPSLSFYTSYVQGFAIPPTGLSAANGELLSPETSEQWEVGLKSELLNRRVTATVAAFSLTKQNVLQSDPNDPGFFITVGEVRNRGVELDVAGAILPGWSVIGAYAYNDSKILNNPDAPTVEGNRFANVPPHSASLWTTYEFLERRARGLKLGAGVVARSRAEGNTANSYQLPGYSVVNLLVGYDIDLGPVRIKPQLNVDNLLDKRYFETSRTTHAIWGSARTIMGSIRITL